MNELLQAAPPLYLSYPHTDRRSLCLAHSHADTVSPYLGRYEALFTSVHSLLLQTRILCFHSISCFINPFKPEMRASFFPSHALNSIPRSLHAMKGRYSSRCYRPTSEMWPPALQHPCTAGGKPALSDFCSGSCVPCFTSC